LAKQFFNITNTCGVVAGYGEKRPSAKITGTKCATSKLALRVSMQGFETPLLVLVVANGHIADLCRSLQL